jgi:hypothetical protein
VPVGKKIRFDESIERKLNSMDVKVNRNYRRNKLMDIKIKSDSRDFEFRTDMDYIMGINGELKGEDGSGLTESNSDYRYDNNKPAEVPSADSIELEKSIEKKKQELKELEEKRKLQKRTVSIKKPAKAELDRYAVGPSAPVLTEWF